MNDNSNSPSAAELRCSDCDNGWEVLIPSVAFKNASSSFFGGKAFCLVLPDLEHLDREIEWFLSRHRAVLLNEATDPGIFFVKTVKRTSSNAAYNQTTFYEAWRPIIQLYGIYNPYTGEGAVKDLLPHGPHSVRDVLATHVLNRLAPMSKQATRSWTRRRWWRSIMAASFLRIRHRWQRRS